MAWIDRKSALGMALAVAIGAVGASVFYAIGIPLPFILGSMFFCLAASVAGAPLAAPGKIRRIFQGIIGAMLGSSFSPELAAQLSHWVMTLVVLVPFLSLSAFGGIFFFRRVMGYDIKTAYFAGMPGGLIEMSAMAEDVGADVRTVTLSHTLRIMMIVSVVPWLLQFGTGADLTNTAAGRPSVFEIPALGYLWFAASVAAGLFIAGRVKLPAGALLAPMLVSAAIHLTGLSGFQVPREVVILTQVVLGSTMGARFVGARIREVLAVVPASFGAVAVMLAVTGGFAMALGQLPGLDPLTIILAYSPGGLTEMGLIAMVLGVDPAFVAAHHLARITVTSFGASLLAGRVFGRGAQLPR